MPEAIQNTPKTGGLTDLTHYALLTREAISVVHNQTLNRRNRRNIRLGYTAYNCVPRRHLCEAIKTKLKTGGQTDLKYYALLTRGAIFGSSLNLRKKKKEDKTRPRDTA